jgi:hypothetical protein
MNMMTFLFFFCVTILFGVNAQWFIIKKDYPSPLMNYPNPGKRSILDENFDVDCSLPYSYFQSTEEKTTWLFKCSFQKSPLDESSSSNSEKYYTPRLILHERRTPRSSPPYFDENRDLFNQRLLSRLRRSTSK